jgi:hypothetical protein
VASDWQWPLRTRAITKAVVCETKHFGEQPTVATVLFHKRLNTDLPIAVSSADLGLQVGESHQGEYCVAKLRFLIPIYSPEPLRVGLLTITSAIAPFQNYPQVISI